MGQRSHCRGSFHALFLCAGTALCCASASAQDSVSTTPGGSDALSAYAEQEVRYVVDASTILSSWSNPFVLAPVLKASADVSPLFSTQVVTASTISPRALGPRQFALRDFALWQNAGAGVNPAENSAPGTLSIGSVSRSFAIGMADSGPEATNALSATIGQRQSDATRLYVTRRVAASSRLSAVGVDTATLSLGAVQNEGDLHLRVDRPQGDPDAGGASVQGDSIVRIDAEARSDSLVNSLQWAGGANEAADAAATTFVRNAALVSTNPPVAAAAPVDGGVSRTLVLDFRSEFLAQGQAPVTNHLDAGVAAQRGNPSYSPEAILPGAEAGVVASLATSQTGGDRADSINLFALDPNGQVAGALSVTLPPSISDGHDFSAINPRFVNWGSQVAFRGGNGPVAIGRSPEGEILLAATAKGDAGEAFIALATLASPDDPPVWSVAAHPGQRILDGPDGQPRGTISSASPIGLSSPAIDSLGNVYFVATFLPTLGAPGTGLFKGVRRPDGSYQLERLLASGQIILGRNSTREYEIAALTLADADSLASGSFFSGNLLPGASSPGVTDPADPRSFSGLVVAALLRYDNAGVQEAYECVLYVGPTEILTLRADLSGDGVVGPADLSILLGAWGTSDPRADLDESGDVGASDLSMLLAAWT